MFKKNIPDVRTKVNVNILRASTGVGFHTPRHIGEEIRREDGRR